THVTPEEADALFAYLRTLPAGAAPNRHHALRFPYRSPIAIAAWRVLFFKPGAAANDPTQTAEWNRGAYLVRGLGHCGACHSPRNRLGAVAGDDELSGGFMPRRDWYAPSLRSVAEAGVFDWSTQDVVALLGTGIAPQASVTGPMAGVVSDSLQHLTPSDLRAIAVFLRSLPQTVPPAIRIPVPDPATLAQGEQIYAMQCANCHGRSGEGAADIYPALAGNRAAMLDVPVNLVRVVRSGAFAPATTGNPRPWGMPPFGHVLDDGQIAAVLTYIRGAWGNTAGPVSAAQTRH
ncbi:MAG: cytochrome c, partial [Burkholderiales bacterium]|nr:cytochrome c [Burkholderiales bacterium]